ncbi:protein kinase domain-containing protein [Actinomadura rudentiformis]|uniref:Protein kinase n=1 Tax=Actinomadura rudentiformis TaxID=359158 RepID=A0A6H9YWD7_9ACTN|nr:protein kinase [Actinomadura rudentiformis]KAB2344376.1 protein kinase [Actinomadura rudentiformis]
MSDQRSRPGAGLRDLRSDDPARVGPYELEAKIGEGGMGAVYLGRAPAGQLVAVKVVRPELAEDRAFLSRFNDEMANAERVASFCTAQVLDHGEDLGMAYMVTEYIDGPSLLQHIQENGPLSPGMLHGVSVGVAAALVAIHSAGLVHRDLKPSNVLLSISGPRVIDFGIARALDAATSHTKTGQVVGTPGYIAPEQILTQQVSPSVDIFAWGCLVAYAANGRNPFGSGSFQIMVGRALHADPDLGALTDPLASLVRTALSKEPERRPSARELLLSLVGGAGSEAEITTHLGEGFPAPPLPSAPPAPEPSSPPVGSPPSPVNLQAPPPAAPQEAQEPQQAPQPRPSGGDAASPMGWQLPAAAAGPPSPPAEPQAPPPPAELWGNVAESPAMGESPPGANGALAPPEPRGGWSEHTDPAGETVTDPAMRRGAVLPPPGPRPEVPQAPAQHAPAQQAPAQQASAGHAPAQQASAGQARPASHAESAPPIQPARHEAEAPTEPPVARPVPRQPSPRGERPKRSGFVVAGAAALTLVAASGAGAAVWMLQSDDKKDPNTTTNGNLTAAGPAPLPTAPMYVRIDTQKGWPKKCYGDIGRFTPGTKKIEPLITGSTCDVLPERSPAGDKIAFTRNDGDTHEAWVANSNGSNPRKVSSDLAGGRLTWSPDGTRLAGMVKDGDNRQIAIMTIATGKVQRLTSDSSEKDDPMWSPKSDTLVFWSKRDDDQAIYTLDIANPATWTKRSKDGVTANDPEWSPDGTKIAYTRGAYPNGDIWVMNADGSGDRKLTKGSQHEMDPNWSRDGKWLAYVRGPYSEPRVRAIRLDGTGDTAITDDADIGHPNW